MEGTISSYTVIPKSNSIMPSKGKEKKAPSIRRVKKWKFSKKKLSIHRTFDVNDKVHISESLLENSTVVLGYFLSFYKTHLRMNGSPFSRKKILKKKVMRQST